MSNIIVINPDDIPTVDELKEAIERLEKDVEVFERIKAGKTQPNLKYIRKVINFLDILYKRKSKE